MVVEAESDDVSVGAGTTVAVCCVVGAGEPVHKSNMKTTMQVPLAMS